MSSPRRPSRPALAPVPDAAPGVHAYIDVVVRIEELVLSRCPRMFRPDRMRPDAVRALAEALAAAARAANEETR